MNDLMITCETRIICQTLRNVLVELTRQLSANLVINGRRVVHFVLHGEEPREEEWFG
jgi:hypothetical protein